MSSYKNEISIEIKQKLTNEIFMPSSQEIIEDRFSPAHQDNATIEVCCRYLSPAEIEN